MIGLAVNAFFIKEMLVSLNQVKIQTSVLLSQTADKERRIAKNEKEIEQFREKVHEMNTHIHQLKNIDIFRSK